MAKISSSITSAARTSTFSPTSYGAKIPFTPIHHTFLAQNANQHVNSDSFHLASVLRVLAHGAVMHSSKRGSLMKQRLKKPKRRAVRSRTNKVWKKRRNGSKAKRPSPFRLKPLPPQDPRSPPSLKIRREKHQTQNPVHHLPRSPKRRLLLLFTMKTYKAILTTTLPTKPFSLILKKHAKCA